MNRKGVISILALIIMIAAAVTSGPGCANIIPPEGGLRDSIPPEILRVTPEDSTLNFGGNKISFTFDEYIQIDNFQQNVLLSPIPKIPPTATYKLNTLSVRLRDTLEENTTYTINFGNAIKDVNEGNIKKDFTYVFSTGSSLDSLSFSGKVILAETGRTDSTLIVILHRSGRDSAVVNDRPRYMARLNGKGNFTFKNLPPGTFYVYALEDNSRAYRYLDKKKLFAFADSPVVIQSNTPSETLFAYAELKQSQTATGGGAAPGQKNAADKRIRFRATIDADGTHDLLKPFSFLFDVPLRRFDSSRVRLATDSLFTPINSGYSWTTDTSRKKVTLNYRWNEGTLYHLILEKDFATDTLGQQMLRPDTITFTTLTARDYGRLSIRFRNLDLTKKPVVQFVRSNEVTSSFPLTSAAFSQALFAPGEYEMRILFDTNGNGVWDPGEFFGKRRQPETVIPIQRTIKVQKNWGNEFEIAL